MEKSFIAYIENSIKNNWDLDALTDYKGPVSFRSIRSKGLRQLAVGVHPFVIPDRAYSEELGLLSDRMRSGYRK